MYILIKIELYMFRSTSSQGLHSGSHGSDFTPRGICTNRMEWFENTAYSNRHGCLLKNGGL